MKPRLVLMNEAGDGTDGKGGDSAAAAAAAKTAADAKSGEHSEMLLRGLAVVAKGVSDMQESNKQLLEFMKTQAEARGNKGGDGGDGGDSGRGSSGSRTDLFAGVDMEQLDRKDFAALLLTKFQEALQTNLKEAMKPLEERVGKIDERVEGDMANREVNAAAGQRPDFYEWRQEIAELVKTTPGLSVTRAYTIARAENPEKVKKMDEKYTKKSAPAAPGFTGILPTGGGGRGEVAGKMKFNEAANKAFDDVLASLGGVTLDQLPVVGKRS